MSLMNKLQKIMTEEIDKETIEIVLDLHAGTQQQITLKQCDHNSRLLRVTLTKNLLYPVKLNNSEMKLYVRKTDGDIVRLDAYEVDEENGIVCFSLTRQALSTLPSIECEVVKIGNDESILSFPLFTIVVQDSIHDGAYDLIAEGEVDVPLLFLSSNEEEEV